MNIQDPSKLHSSSGHESHAGVHLCYKCGWPFPNPHPSAKHRRSHKKVCGTIEGYKLSALSVLDNERLSDDDQKTPSPKVTKKSFSGSDSGGVLERSDKSGDDVFSDAATDFSDAGASSGVDEMLNDSLLVYITGDDKSPAQSVDGAAARDIIQSENNTSNSSQVQNVKNSESISVQLQSTTQTLDDERSKLLDSATEGSAIIVNHGKGSPSDDLPALKLEMSPDAHEVEIKTSVQDLPESTPVSLAVEIQKGNDEQFDTPNGQDRETSEEMICVEETNICSPVPTSTETNGSPPQTVDEGITLVKEEQFSDSAAEAFLADPSGEVESLAFMGTQVDSSQAEEKSSEEPKVVAENVGLEPDILQDTMVRSADEIDTNIDTSPTNVIDGGNYNEDVHVLSIPNDLHAVDRPEIMLKGFKGHKELVLNETYPSMPMKDTDVLGSFPEENVSALNKSVQDMGDASSGYSHQDVGICKVAIEEVSTEQVDKSCTNEVKACDGPLLDQHVSGPTDYVATPVEDDVAPNFQELQEVSNDLSRKQVQQNPMLVLPNVSSLVSSVPPDVNNTSNLVDIYDAGGLYEGEMFDVSGVDPLKEFGKKSHGSLGSSISNRDGSDAPHNASDAPVCENNETSIVVNLASNEKATPELGGCMSESLVTESGIENSVYSLSRKDSTHKSDAIRDVNLVRETPSKMSHHDADFLGDLESDINNSSKILVEYSAVVDTVDDTKDSDVGFLKKSLGKQDVDSTISPTAAKDSSNNITHIERDLICELDDPSGFDSASLREESHSNLSKQTVFSVVDVLVDKGGENDNVGGNRGPLPDSAMLTTTSDAPEDPKMFQAPKDVLEGAEGENPRRLGGDHSDVDSSLLQEDTDKNLIKQQPALSTLDISVDTSSQNDSVDGNWGSVSDTTMFSALSDAPEDQKSSVKSKDILAGMDRSENFEPPSFMTLVEPKDQINTAAASETGEAQNLHQSDPSLQAGWFPSLTHVANDTKGRKKNEEIIAKVTNWSTIKQHNNLKNLLGEASLETKMKSPNAEENLAPVAPVNEVPSKNGGSFTTLNSILDQEELKAEASATEAAKVWSSPARYPSEIKREKKKIKGRLHWVPFMCCSSVN